MPVLHATPCRLHAMILRLTSPLVSLSCWRMLLAASLVVSLLGCGNPVATVPPAPVASFPGNSDPPLLIDAAWLRDQRRRPDVDIRILDLSPPRDYAQGHIPGAIHAWWQDAMDPYYPVYGVVLANRNDPNARKRYIDQLDITSDTIVVAYDNDNNRYAARVVWTLRYFGHEEAAILDGGLAAWRGLGAPISRDSGKAPDVRPMDIKAQAGFIIGTRELQSRLADPSVVVLDARSEAEARDDLNGSLRIGRIPGAVSVPWTATLRDDAGRLKPPDDLMALLVAAGVTPDREVVIYARFGVEAAQPWLVLSLLGYPNVRVYDQGWAEWASKPELPIAPLASEAAGTPGPTGTTT